MVEVSVKTIEINDNMSFLEKIHAEILNSNAEKLRDDLKSKTVKHVANDRKAVINIIADFEKGILVEREYILLKK